MKLDTTTHLDADQAEIFARVSDPRAFAAISDKIVVSEAGPEAWTMNAEMNGAPVEADLTRTECVAPDRVSYLATAQGLEITIGFDVEPAGTGSDLRVTVDFAGASMKGKMLMQGLKLMAPKMQSGLERMVAKLAAAA